MFETLTGDWPYTWETKRELLGKVMKGDLERHPITDAAITVNERMIVIATYEKAEALLRFIGPQVCSNVWLCALSMKRTASSSRPSPRSKPLLKTGRCGSKR